MTLRNIRLLLQEVNITLNFCGEPVLKLVSVFLADMLLLDTALKETTLLMTLVPMVWMSAQKVDVLSAQPQLRVLATITATTILHSLLPISREDSHKLQDLILILQSLLKHRAGPNNLTKEVQLLVQPLELVTMIGQIPVPRFYLNRLTIAWLKILLNQMMLLMLGMPVPPNTMLKLVLLKIPKIRKRRHCLTTTLL